MERMKVFIACAIGGGIGTMVALSFYQNIWFFVLGFIVGCLTGYCSYEFKMVISAVRISWKSVIGWRPDMKLMKMRCTLFMWVYVSMISVVLGFHLIISLSAYIISGFVDVPLASSMTAIITLSSAALFVSLIAWGTAVETKSDSSEGKLEELTKQNLSFKKLNPFSVYFYWLPKGIIWTLIGIPYCVITIVKSIPAAIKWLYSAYRMSLKFIKTVFILIHSEARLICGVDAGIGVFVGSFTGHIIIGALVGGIIGLLNYEIVSKRILQLVPKRT